MKQIKYIPLLLIVGLVSACNFNSTVSAPKFKNLGDKIEDTVFLEEVGAIYDKLDVNDSTMDFVSREVKGTTSTYNETKITREKKDIYVSKETVIEKQTGKFCFNSSILDSTRNTKTNTSLKSVTENRESSNVEDVKASHEPLSYNDQAYFASIDKTEKVVTLTIKTTELTPASFYARMITAALENSLCGVSTLKSILNNYPYEGEEGKKNYSFFKNDSMYTVVYQEKDTGSFQEDGKVIYKYESNKIKEYQYEFNGEDIKYRSLEETTTSTDYYETYSGYPVTYKGDHKELISKKYAEGEMSKKEINLYPTDTSGYAFLFPTY